MKKLLTIIFALAILGSTPLHAMEQPKDLIQAAKDDDLERVKELIEQKVNLDDTSDDSTALHIAVENNNLELVTILVEAGAKINLLDKADRTALILAIVNNFLPIVQYLIKQNIDINYGAYGYSPLMGAAHAGYLAIVQELIKASANPNIQDSEGDSALMVAVRSPHRDDDDDEIITALLTDISDEDVEQIKNNFTGFLVINKMQFIPKDVRKMIVEIVVQELIDERLQRANEILKLKDRNQDTAQDIALAQGHQKIADLLDPNNVESQKKLRAIIEVKIRHILFGEPARIKFIEKTIELDDPFGTWN